MLSITTIDAFVRKIRDASLKDVSRPMARFNVTTKHARMNDEQWEAIAVSDQFSQLAGDGETKDSGYGFDASGNWKRIFMVGRDGFTTGEDWILG